MQQVLNISTEHPDILPPLFGLKHNDPLSSVFWQYHPPANQSDVCGHLSVVHPTPPPTEIPIRPLILSPHLLCNNGMMTLELPDNPRLECTGSLALPSTPSMIMSPTARIRRSLGVKNRLNLLVHLKGAFTALFQEDQRAENLRALMALYCLRNHSVSQAWLQSVAGMSSRMSVASVGIAGHQCFTQGRELIIELDAVCLKEVSVMMFANLLDFLAGGYVDYHSFIEVVIRLKGESGEYVRCTRRHGYQARL